MSNREWQKIKENANITEAYFAALCWNNPELYDDFNETKINKKHFIHDIWGFYFSLGRHMHNNNIKVFDDISVYRTLKELSLEDKFKEYNGLQTIEEVIDAVRDYESNIDSYYEGIKKNYVIKQLCELFGSKVLNKKGKYDYSKMTKEQLITYWNDKINQIALKDDTNFDEYDLVTDPDKYIESIEEQGKTGLPLYKSKLMNSITNGVHKGHVVMFGGYGNSGKTSIVFEKYIMSCIKNKEGIVVIANEENIKSFRDKLTVTVLNGELKEGINRKKLNQGNLTEKEKDKIRRAFYKVRELTEGNDSQVKFVFMENYIMKDAKRIIKYYHNRGYENFLIDTHKVSEDSPYADRRETFVEDMKELYKITRPNAGGLNLRMWVNIQLADWTIKNRYLDFEAIGEGKAAKNEASVVMMIRNVWADELEGGKHEIEGFRFVPDELNGGYKEQKFKLEKGKIYYLLFTPKNRFGANTDGGQPVLIIEVNFNSNHWKEIGWCYIANDKNR